MNPEQVADTIFARALSDEVCECEVRQFSNKPYQHFFPRKKNIHPFSFANFAQGNSK